MITDEWLAGKDARYRGEAEILLAQMQKAAGKVEVTVDKHSILGLGRDSKNYPKIALTVRKDGLRLYANVSVLAKYKAALGKTLTGKCCVTLKRAADIDGKLLARIVKDSLAANGLREK